MTTATRPSAPTLSRLGRLCATLASVLMSTALLMTVLMIFEPAALDSAHRHCACPAQAAS